MRRVSGVLLLCLALGWLGMAASAAAAPEKLEELRYRVSLGPWEEVALVHLRLTRVGPERYRAQFGGAAQGFWSLLQRWLPEGYESDMALEDGRLKPLRYREKFYSQGKHIDKEYRFDYSRGVLEIWRGVDGRPAVKDWQGPLKGPVYDPLTLFYNLRLGAVGPVTPGQTLSVTLVPNPERRTMLLNIGPNTPQGHKVMVSLRKDDGAKNGPYFVWANPQRVPLRAWVRVLVFGKLAGQLLNPGEIMEGGLTRPSQLSRKGGKQP
ncbi:MAG: DUF3108 domain-containing protein [Thermodesulfobacteriota bacterium]